MAASCPTPPPISTVNLSGLINEPLGFHRFYSQP